ncbi:hypothetical protein HYALB_00006551 [Hymenoscyphus albidus]|uniref:Rhodopsin domain-containing protein n=1 Tax=Hymenoscyphus albidus TaxID=595503 RepID=A0A9N9LUZ4_9HELO|nr:hypothetical protein HYALB_00006551 [Hymenoscyphus albidus]
MTIMDLIIPRHDIDPSERPIDRPDNHSPILNVCSWFLGVCNIVTVVSRVLSKAIYSKNLGLDDILICVALVFCIAQVMAFSYGVYYGAGRHIDKLSQEEILGYQKAIYASNILWHQAQVFSKLSVTSFVRTISPTQWNKKGSTVVYGITVVWGITALLILAFRCNTPNTWQTIGNVCLDIHYVWGYINSMNIAIDLLLIGLPYSVLWKIKLPPRKKILVFSFFGARIIAVVAIGYQAYRTYALTETNDPSDDVTFNMWIVHLTMSIAQTADIVTACVPFLKPLVDGLESGMIRTNDFRPRTLAVGTSRHGTVNPDTRRNPEGYFSHKWRAVTRRRSGSGSSVLVMPRGRYAYAMEPIYSGTSNSRTLRNSIDTSTTVGDGRCQEHDWCGIQSHSSQGNMDG